MESLKLPRAVVLELTYKCNHHCKFCSCPWENPDHSFSKGSELATEEWFTAIERLYDLGVENFSLSGGEAILRPDIEKIIRHIRTEGRKRNLHNKIVIISNGRNMTEELLELFAQEDVHLSMSLPGYKTFQWHTGVDNADSVLRWFQKAKEKGVHTTAGITVTKKNYDELYRTIALALINGAEHILLNRFLIGGRGLAYREELELSGAQLKGMLTTAEEVLGKAGRFGNVGTEYPLCMIPRQKFKHLGIGSMCAAATEFFVIGPSGEVRVCNHSPRVIGNVKSDNIIQDIQYWSLFAERKYMPAECSECKIANFCACGCREVAHIVTGNVKSIDPCLERSKIA